ncbi:MAG TPA: NAD(P)-binding protein [Pseudonocardia sp.]
MTEDTAFDALVIGAGAGGMAAAARLQHAGYRTLLVEQRDRVGGRASSMEVESADGTFTVNTGALIFELGGENGRLFDDVGAQSGALEMERPLTLRLGGRDIALMSGPTGAVFGRLISGVGILAARLPRMRPKRGVDTETWLRSLHVGAKGQALVRSLCSALFAAQPADIEAALFFDYLTKPDALGTYGAHPEGSVGPWRALAEHFQREGGTLWLNSTVDTLTFDDTNLVSGAAISRAGQTVTVSAGLAVSNAGPPLTVRLCGAAAPPDWAAEVRENFRPGTLITINFASRVPMSRFDGLVFFGTTQRLAYGAAINVLSPKMVPDGWYLYACAGTPNPTSWDFDLDAEVELLKQDLRRIFPEFATAQIISVEVTSAARDWPAQWAIAGQGRPNTTPIANLWNVGDGVYEWTGAGQSGCVQTARLVVEQIRRRFPR